MWIIRRGLTLLSDCDWFGYSAHERWLCCALAQANVKILLGSVLNVSSEGVTMLISTLTCTSYGDGVRKRVCDHSNTSCILLCVWVSALPSRRLHTSSCWSRKSFSFANINCAHSSPWVLLKGREPWRHVRYRRVFSGFLAPPTFTVAWWWKEAVISQPAFYHITHGAADAGKRNLKSSACQSDVWLFKISSVLLSDSAQF